MTSVTDDVALTMDDMPLGDGGLIVFRRLAVNPIETMEAELVCFSNLCSALEGARRLDCVVVVLSMP